jgi:hypothetical protein
MGDAMTDAEVVTLVALAGFALLAYVIWMRSQ